MIFILLNMMTMAMEHHDEPKEYKAVLGHINSIFIVVFTLEFIMKLLALRQYYFKEPWNVFDFVVVVGSILSTVLLQFTFIIYRLRSLAIRFLLFNS